MASNARRLGCKRLPSVVDGSASFFYFFGGVLLPSQGLVAEWLATASPTDAEVVVESKAILLEAASNCGINFIQMPFDNIDYLNPDEFVNEVGVNRLARLVVSCRTAAAIPADKLPDAVARGRIFNELLSHEIDVRVEGVPGSYFVSSMCGTYTELRCSCT